MRTSWYAAAALIGAVFAVPNPYGTSGALDQVKYLAEQAATFDAKALGDDSTSYNRSCSLQNLMVRKPWSVLKVVWSLNKM